MPVPQAMAPLCRGLFSLRTAMPVPGALAGAFRPPAARSLLSTLARPRQARGRVFGPAAPASPFQGLLLVQIRPQSGGAEPKRRRLLSFRNLGILFKVGLAGGAIFLGYWLYVAQNPPTDQLEFGDPNLPTLAVLGSGWGATSFIDKLDTTNYNVVVISPRNYFLFTPLLPSCTTGTIELRSLCMPLRFLTGYKKRKVKFIEAEVKHVDLEAKTISFADESDLVGAVSRAAIKYDYLVTAVGAENATFGIPGVKEHACFLKELPDAKAIRIKLMDCLETAAFPSQPPEEIDRLLHFVVVGGGPTGVEYSAELRDFLVDDVVKWYPEIAGRVHITLIEALPHVLPSFSAKLVEYTEKHFAQEKVDIKLNTMVKEVHPDHLVVQEKSTQKVKKVVDGVEQEVEEAVTTMKNIPYGLLVWATGNAMRPMVKNMISQLPQDIQNSRRGLVIDEHLVVKGSDGSLFAMGDCSHSKFAPTAQVASQQGYYLAKIFNERGEIFAGLRKALPLAGAISKVNAEILPKEKSFDYLHKGSLAYIGTDEAIADLPFGVQISGFATFLFWRSVYLTNLLSIKNKLIVAFDWSKTMIFGRDISRE
ncbi:hypothetical protein DFJ74DRAFT_652664 [Hyaloraphidium curvatum]|nr:hypothetical protein DFJ74DRAFT_652664 [Hyaloraphidium curvatum]